MGTLTRWVGAVGLALGTLIGSAGVAVACTTDVGGLDELPPRFHLAFIGRVVGEHQEAVTLLPVAYTIEVERVVYGSLETGTHRFPVSDPCKAMGAPLGERVLWALTDPPDLSLWTTLAWRLEPDGTTTVLLSPWYEYFPFPEQMSRAELGRFLRANAALPETATAAPAQPVTPAADPGAVILAAAAVGGALSLVRSRQASVPWRRRA